MRELSLRETHIGLRKDLGLLRQASYCAALLEQATETETPLDRAFGLMTGLLAHLMALPPTPVGIFSFELKLLTELGLKPDLDKSRLNPGTTQLVRTLTETDWPIISRLRPTTAQAAELDHFLHGFVVQHLGRIPKGRETALGLQPHRPHGAD